MLYYKELHNHFTEGVLTCAHLIMLYHVFFLGILFDGPTEMT